MRHAASLTFAALCLLAAPASAYMPTPCGVLEEDGRVSHFLLGYPDAELADETDAYGHGVLGDAVEYRSIRLVTHGEPRSAAEGPAGGPVTPRAAFTATLPAGRVFEDVALRVFSPLPPSWTIEAYHPPPSAHIFAVVETEASSGASLSLYAMGCTGIEKVAATPPIGTAFRWLAPAGIEDFDRDGRTDIAYVEAPHLGGILKIVSLIDGELKPIVPPMAGFSNHRIGEDFITSGVRLCREAPVSMLRDGHVELPMVQRRQPELLVPSRDRTTLHAVRIKNGAFVVEDRPEPPTPEGVRVAKTCNPEEPAQ